MGRAVDMAPDPVFGRSAAPYTSIATVKQS